MEIVQRMLGGNKTLQFRKKTDFMITDKNNKQENEENKQKLREILQLTNPR